MRFSRTTAVSCLIIRWFFGFHRERGRETLEGVPHSSAAVPLARLVPDAGWSRGNVRRQVRRRAGRTHRGTLSAGGRMRRCSVDVTDEVFAEHEAGDVNAEGVGRVVVDTCYSVVVSVGEPAAQRVPTTIQRGGIV